MKKKLKIFSILLLGLFLFAQAQSTKPVLFKLKDIRDVSKTAPTNGQILVYVAATRLWTPAASTGGAPTDAHYLTDQAEGGLSAEVVVTANGKSLVTAANYAAMRGLLDLESGVDFAPLAGSSSIVTVGTLSAGDATAVISAASDTVAGKIEIATIAETNTGTDTGRAVSPDGLAGSVLGTKTLVVKPIAETTIVTAGDGFAYFTIPAELNGMNLVSVGAHVYTADTGTDHIHVDIYNVTQTADMLSAAMQVEDAEYDTITSAVPGTIDAANDDVATGDVIRIDVTTYAGSSAKGLEIRLGFRLP